MSFTDDWKLILLQRWAGEYPPATPDDDCVLKSSQDIADDLRGAGEFTADEVSAFMAVNGYRIVFEGGYPYWGVKSGSTGNLIGE